MSDFSLVPFHSLDSPNYLFSASIFLVVLPLKLSILTISRGEIRKNCTLGTSGKNNCIMNGVITIHKCTCVVTSCFIVFHFSYKELKLPRKEFQKISLFSNRTNTGLKLNIQKTKIMASGSITSWQIDDETMETVADFILLGS